MKHFWIGICLLGALLCASLGAMFALDETADAMEPLLESAWERSLREDMEGAAEDAARALALWERHHALAASLVDHERLEEIDRGFGDLATYGRQAKAEEYAQVCHDLVLRIRAMAEAEKPYFYNFL